MFTIKSVRPQSPSSIALVDTPSHTNITKIRKLVSGARDSLKTLENNPLGANSVGTNPLNLVEANPLDLTSSLTSGASVSGQTLANGSNLVTNSSFAFSQATQSPVAPRKLELLAPAKNLEVGTAALLAGADAIYIGGSGFGARAAAGNNLDDIAALCALAHRFGARVYLTVNTLLYDHELEAVRNMIHEAVTAGVDALIVQDPAVLTFPEVQHLEIHASTQWNINTLAKVAYCQQLGISQVVLPREFSTQQIQKFCQAFPELRFEVFVSGAMCVSVSGECFISEYMTKRSANRGECAQICRLPMELYHESKLAKVPESKGKTDFKVEAETESKIEVETESKADAPKVEALKVDSPKVELIARGHLLSMKDNLRLQQLDQLVEAGACSFKIEGRLKDRDYVVNQVSAFRERLDALIEAHPDLYARASLGKIERKFIPDVNKTFNRGFTHAYLADDNTDLVETRTPKSFGQKLGVVKLVKVTDTLSSTMLDRNGVERKGKAWQNKGGSSNQQVFRAKSGGFKGVGNAGKFSNAGKFGNAGKQGNVTNGGMTGNNANFQANGSCILELKVNQATTVSNGDSFTFFDVQGQLQGFRVNRVSSSLNANLQGNAAKVANTTNATKGAKLAHKAHVAKGSTVSKETNASNASNQLNNSSNATNISGVIEVTKGQVVYLHLAQIPAELSKAFTLSAQQSKSPAVVVYRNVDANFIKQLEQPKAVQRKVKLQAKVNINQVEQAEHQACCVIEFKDEYSRTGLAKMVFEVNEQEPLTTTVLSDKLLKLGDEYLYLDGIEFTGDLKLATFPISSFNQLRREALADYVSHVQSTRAQLWQQSQEHTQQAQEQTQTKERIPYLDTTVEDKVYHKPAQWPVWPVSSVDPRLITNAQSRMVLEAEREQPLEPPRRLQGKAVMTCRTCLIKNHATCHKLGGRTTGYFLMIGGQRFDLVTDCKRCLMYVIPHAER